MTSKERPALVLERRVMRALAVTLIAVSLVLVMPASAPKTLAAVQAIVRDGKIVSLPGGLPAQLPG